MSPRPRHNGHDKYKSRIANLLKSFDEDSNPESQAHSAKYLAVLVSGYLEQAIKELLLHYSSLGSRQQISRYIEETWPVSKNMTTVNIHTILRQFNKAWGDDFNDWLKQHDDRKGHINLIVSWRNRISHGQESNVTDVTLVSVKNIFVTAQSLVAFLESTILELNPK
jgi:hypothetical protein